mmetsp:Transcript_70182/g.187006  ORF Transcript_70182/g.187006 Transcript_70182/m.187006 type:complete len:97 (-) Transcript_70182:866-1156(-)
MRMSSIMCLLIASKTFDTNPITMSCLIKRNYFSKLNVSDLSKIELEVLKILKYDVGRDRSVQMLEHVSEILSFLKGVLEPSEAWCFFVSCCCICDS